MGGRDTIKKPRFEDHRFQIPLPSERDGGGLLITFPDLPGFMSAGETCNATIANGREVFADRIEACRESGREIPRPGSI